MRILVTGGAGYIGSHTVRVLQSRGHLVWVYDNLSFGHREAVSSDQLIVGDLKDLALLDHTMLINRIEAIVHFAAFTSVGESVQEPAKYYQNNFVNALGLMETMRRNHVGRLVFSSTAATYGTPDAMPLTEDSPKQPINPYGRSKLMVEQAMADYANAYQWGTTALRYFNASGASADGKIGEDHTPETHLIPLVIAAAMGKRSNIEIFGTDYPTADGTCIRDYIHVDDLATAHALAIEQMKAGEFRAYNLGIGRGYSVREVIQTVEAVTGLKVPLKLGTRRAGDPPELVASPAKAMKELGWKPKYLELEQIVETAWNWHRANPNGYAR